MELEKKLAIAEAKLAETEQEFERLKGNLGGSRKRKADLMASIILEQNEKDKKELADMSKIMIGLESDIKIMPEVILALKAKIGDYKAEIDRKKAVIAQKEKVKEEKKLLEMCREFYKSLEETNLLNDKLKEMENQFRAKWGNLPGGKGITIGSGDSLKALWQTVEKEFRGEGRQTIPFRNMPEFRI
ncbi:hypothetical protein ES705_18574 [subsurface metagenome]|nr:MAG: hypothetical protein ES695_18185 [Candidatus Atribacteria bacterium 1244-E10-H5-B2]